MRVGRTTTDNSRALLNKRQADLQEMLDRWHAVIEHALNAITNELTKGHGHKAEGISREDIAKIRELSTAMRAAADTKIQLAKAAKLLADAMTSEEVLAAAVKRVMAEPQKSRAEILSKMVHDHRDQVLLTGSGRSPLQDPETAIDLIREAMVHPAGNS